MKSRFLWFAAAALALALAAACSEDDSNPVGPALELNSGNIANNQSFAHRFGTAGGYGYHCTFHPAMNGNVTVSDAATDTLVVVTIVNSSATGFQPGTATVKTNGQVRWDNTSGTTHTVTSH